MAMSRTRPPQRNSLRWILPLESTTWNTGIPSVRAPRLAPSHSLSPELGLLSQHAGWSYRCGGRPVVARLYLLDCLDKLIISDVDGTITRSDLIGHLPAVRVASRPSQPARLAQLETRCRRQPRGSLNASSSIRACLSCSRCVRRMGIGCSISPRGLQGWPRIPSRCWRLRGKDPIIFRAVHSSYHRRVLFRRSRRLMLELSVCGCSLSQRTPRRYWIASSFARCEQPRPV